MRIMNTDLIDSFVTGFNDAYLSSEVTLSPIVSETYVVTETKPALSKGPSIVTTSTYPAYYTQDLILVEEPYTGVTNYDYYTHDGLNEYAYMQINDAMRKAFLHDYLHEEYSEIIDRLKVVKGKVKVAGAKENVKKDTKETLKKKVKFIEKEILTKAKNMKILYSITKKNSHISFSDLPSNPDLVANTQAKYIKRKIREMRK